MFNSPNPYQNSGSYIDLLKRMTQRMQQQKVDDQLLEILQQAFEKELNAENIILSRPERARLFRQVTKAIWTDMLGKFDDKK
ncbi:MAG: hypothetical protein L6461_13985 [Anaerolineae bacterium]|nr:hypothetical protein [Anaerolineae bacterium]